MIIKLISTLNDFAFLVVDADNRVYRAEAIRDEYTAPTQTYTLKEITFEVP